MVNRTKPHQHHHSHRRQRRPLTHIRIPLHKLLFALLCLLFLCLLISQLLLSFLLAYFDELTVLERSAKRYLSRMAPLNCTLSNTQSVVGSCQTLFFDNDVEMQQKQRRQHGHTIYDAETDSFSMSCPRNMIPMYHDSSIFFFYANALGLENVFGWRLYPSEQLREMYEESSSSFVLSEVSNFILAAQHEAHDMHGYQTLFLDPDIAQYLQWLRKNDRLSRAAVFIVADHGAHYGPLYHKNMTQALLEHESPFAALILPRYLWLTHDPTGVRFDTLHMMTSIHVVNCRPIYPMLLLM